jgi:hypothetical protein
MSPTPDVTETRQNGACSPIGPYQEPLRRVVLEMRPECERCGSPLANEAEAFICSFECTFCPDCSASFDAVCPNCSGELVARPRRVATAV